MTKIKYKNNEFEIVGNNLKILNKAIPVLVKHQKLTAEYMKDIDTARLDELKAKVSYFEEAIRQVKAKENKEDGDDEYLGSLELKLQDATALLNTDEEAQMIRRMQNEVAGLVLTEIATDETLMNKLFENLLKGDLKLIKVEENDLQDYLQFVGEVLAYFFGIIGKVNF